MSMKKCIEDFNSYLDKMYALKTGANLLYWDNMTEGPKGGLRTRAKALAILSNEAFKMSISNEMKAFLDELGANEGNLDEITRAKFRLCKKAYYDSVNIPPEEALEFEEHLILSNEAWEEAKNSNDFNHFAPFLKKNIETVKRFAKYREPENPLPYNTLLGDYEPDVTIEQLDVFFAKLRSRIVPLLKNVIESKKVIEKSFLDAEVSIEAQRKIGLELAEMIGYDFSRGMLKETEHPFSLSLSKFDSRITTHYHKNMVLSSVFSVLHECGHSIYEQNKADEIAETLLDDGVSMAIHESQSRFYENVIGRSRAFWDFAWDKVKGLFGEAFSNVSAEQIYEAANIAAPSLIRIEADELTYALHIMVRYEIEKMIFDDGFDLADIEKLPDVWNKKYEEYLGITPPTDTLGILQDVHWSGASFGYFPSYALGSAYSAQLLSYMERDIDVFGLVSKGEIMPVSEWLKEKIHKHGSVYKPADLFRKITGEDLNADYYINYLEEKFSKLYGF